MKVQHISSDNIVINDQNRELHQKRSDRYTIIRQMQHLCNHPLGPDYLEYCKLGNQKLTLDIQLGYIKITQ